MQLSGHKLLVTGASGFVGSFLVEHALAAGAEVWAAVRPTSSRRYLTDGRIRFVELDLGDDATLRRQVEAHARAEGPWTACIHAAGVTKCRHEDDFFRVNTEGTLRLARTLQETGALHGRFVFVSSLSVMGPVREKPVKGCGGRRYAPITNADEPRPDTAYGRSKLEAEEGLALVPGLDYVILRPTGVYGPRDKDYYLMALSVKRHIDTAAGLRPQELTFVYVRDLADAALLAISHGQKGAAYFLTDGGVYGSSTFARLLQQAMGVKGLVRICVPLWMLRAVCHVAGTLAAARGRTSTLNADKYHIMKQRNWQCDTTPARNELGWQPAYDLERGVAETVAWYKQERWL